MGIAERKEREKEQRQKSIIDAAEKVFFSKGVENSTMDEVAEEAELSKGTLYLYFKNKDEILHAIVFRSLSVLYSMFENAVKGTAKGIDKLLAIGNAYMEFYKNKSNYFSVLFHDDEHHKDYDRLEECPFMSDVKSISDKVFGLLAGVIEEGIKDGSIRSDLDPLKTSLVLWGHTSGMMQILKSKSEVIETHMGMDPEELVNYSFQLIKNCIETKE